MRAYPANVPWVRRRFALSEDAWTALHALWQQRFQHDPALKERWQALVAQSVPYWKR